MRPINSLLATAALAALSLTPLTSSAEVQANTYCRQLAETGQVQCSGILVGVGQVAARVEVTVPYYCAGQVDRLPPDLLTGQTTIDQTGADTVSFQLLTNAASCNPNQPPRYGSQAALRVMVGTDVVVYRNVPVLVTPDPQTP